MPEGSSQTVLLVDDDPVILRLLEVNFELEGFEVHKAVSGEGAMTLAEQASPDAAVLDLWLPDANGYDLAVQLRRLPALDQLPIVFLSGLIEDEDVPAPPRSTRMNKPFDPAEVIGAIRGFFMEDA